MTSDKDATPHIAPIEQLARGEEPAIGTPVTPAVPGRGRFALGGKLVLYLERGGRSLLTAGDVSIEHLKALIGMAVLAGRVELQKVDGVAVVDSPFNALLREAGFTSTHRGLVAYSGRG